MFRLRGRIDFAQLQGAGAGEPLASQGDMCRIEAPGIELQWRSEGVDVYRKRNAIALATGRARDARRSKSQGDAAFWLDRYDAFGANAASEVGGAFSVVILDLVRRELVLFVDRFSIETLCYRHELGAAAFSDAAAYVPGDRPALDPQAVYDYLYFHVVPAPQTAFVGIHRLQGAQRATLSRAAADVDSYWQPAVIETDRHDLEGRMREFVRVVEHAVAEEADEPLTACFLSGGTDSSTIAGMLQHQRSAPVHAYSIGFDAEGYDEMAYARIAARHFGLEHHEYYVTPKHLLEAIPGLARSFDQPFGNSSVLPAYYCALRARGDGFARILAGDGGDELFGGNSRYAVHKLFALYQGLPPALRAKVLEPAALEWTLFRRVAGFRQLGGYVRHARLPMPDRLDAYNLLLGLGDEQVLDPQWLARIDRESPLRQRRSTWSATTAESQLNRMLAYDWKFTLADSDLPKVRAATQFAGIAAGYPFLNRAVTDLSLTLPPEWKVRHLRLRWFFKRALREFLPGAILRKRKHGFGLPFGAWVLRDAALRELAQSGLDALARRGVVRSDFVTLLQTRLLREAPGYYGEMVWILLMLEQWLQSHEAGVAVPLVGRDGDAALPDGVRATMRTMA